MRGIYFVGGASASGKSTTTTALASEYGVARIELDAIWNKLAVIDDNCQGCAMTPWKSPSP